MNKLAILSEPWSHIQQHMKRDYPDESGGFLLARAVEAESGVRLVVDEIIDPFEGDDRWRLQNQQQLAPSGEYMSKTAARADNASRIPVFIHNHPTGTLKTFSYADDWAHEAWAPFFEGVGQNGFISILVAGDGDNIEAAIADVWSEGEQYEVDTVTVARNQFHRSVRAVVDSDSHPSNSQMDRQERMWSEYGQALLENSRVAIVGLGGTGSAAAVQCARAGVGELLLIDYDDAEESNLNRLYGLTPSQAESGASKTEVVTEHLHSISGVDIDTIDTEITDYRILPTLLDADVILGCTDSEQSRAYLNKQALLYGIPYVDVGCGPEANEGEVLSLWAEVRRVLSGGPCLFCMDVVDSQAVGGEGLPNEAREDAQRDEYLPDDVIEPSLVTMTTTAASMGVTQAFALLVSQPIYWDPQHAIDVWSGLNHVGVKETQADCVCQSDQWVPYQASLADCNLD